MIELAMWERLVTIHECSTLSKAAEKLYITQSALSRSMQKLEDQLDVNLTDSEKKPETTPPPAPSQEEQQAASEKDEPIVHEPDSNQPQTGDTQGGSIYLEGFGWITDEGGGSVQHNIDSDGDINKQVGNMG